MINPITGSYAMHEGDLEKLLNERKWKDFLLELNRIATVSPDGLESPNFRWGKLVLEARAGREAQRLRRWTVGLVVATALLTIATAALAVLSA